jgi:hypothetical protein
MRRSTSSTTVRLLDLGSARATVPIPAPTSRTSSSGRTRAAATRVPPFSGRLSRGRPRRPPRPAPGQSGPPRPQGAWLVSGCSRSPRTSASGWRSSRTGSIWPGRCAGWFRGRGRIPPGRNQPPGRPRNQRLVLRTNTAISQAMVAARARERLHDCQRDQLPVAHRF